MDWNGNHLRVPLVSRPENSAFSFLYNYNYDQFSGLEMKQASMQNAMVPSTTDKNNTSMMSMMYGQDPKKKRLSTEQLESLENSFQEEIKLDPDRKMKLAKELGLQPRQIAVWFQNRRARWKGKQLERLYDALKQEYDAVSRDKHKLQQELDLKKNMLDMPFMKVRHVFITWEAIKVLALRAMLKEQVVNKQVSTGYTEVSGEETVESTSIPNSDKAHGITTMTNINNVNQIIMGESSYALNVDDYTSVMMTPYNWA